MNTILDWTVNLGNVISFALFLATVVGAHFAIKIELKGMSKDLGFLGGRMINVENNLKELTKVTVTMAEAKKDLEAVVQRLDEQSRRLNVIDEYFLKRREHS